MGITRLKRKARRNKQTAAKRQNSMKQLNSQPVIKNIDQEAIKASFGTAPAPVVEEPVAEVVEATPEGVVEEVVEESAEAPVAEATEEVAAEAETEEAPVAEANDSVADTANSEEPEDRS